MLVILLEMWQDDGSCVAGQLRGRKSRVYRGSSISVVQAPVVAEAAKSAPPAHPAHDDNRLAQNVLQAFLAPV
jgi:hypothetical protein